MEVAIRSAKRRVLIVAMFCAVVVPVCLAKAARKTTKRNRAKALQPRGKYVQRQERSSITCTVKVFDTNANPVVGAEVAALEYFYHGSEGYSSTELLDGIKKTDSKGHCRLNLNIVHEHGVDIVVRKKELAIGCRRLLYNMRTVNPTINIVLGKPRIVEGTVVDEEGGGLANATVYAQLDFRGQPKDWFTTRTNAKGEFIFSNIPVDTRVDLFAQTSQQTLKHAPGWVTLGDPAGEKDIRIVLYPEATIEGRVVYKQGNSVSGVKLKADPIKGRYYAPHLAISGPDGKFSFPALPKDIYTLELVYEDDSPTAQWVIQKEMKVAVRSGQTKKRLVLRVSKGGILDIVVSDMETQKPIPNAEVNIHSRSKWFKTHYRFWKTARTDNNGKVIIRMPPGKSHVSVAANGYYISSMEFLAIKGKMSMPVFLQKFYRVSGVVRDPNGLVVSEAEITALHANYQSIRTDKSGRFAFDVDWTSRVRSGYIFARHLARNLGGISEVTDDNELNIELRPAFSVTGKVTDQDARPIPAARVELVSGGKFGEKYFADEVITNSRGCFLIPTIPQTVGGIYYYIKVSASGYSQVQSGKISLDKVSEGKVELEPIVLKAGKK
jgi:hypothetical protein